MNAKLLLSWKARIFLAIIFLVNGIMCSGCGTLTSHAANKSGEGAGQKGVFQGVRLDAKLIANSNRLEEFGVDTGGGDKTSLAGCIICFGIWDMPFSAAMDTLLLSIDLIPSK